MHHEQALPNTTAERLGDIWLVRAVRNQRRRTEMGMRMVKAESHLYRQGKDPVVFRGGYNPFPGAYKFTRWECVTGSLPTQGIL